MDDNLQAVLRIRIDKTIKNLEKNNMSAFYVPDKEQALKKALSLLNDGDVVTCGGSVTLKEIGMNDALKAGNYVYLDRDDPALSKEEVFDLFRKAYSADAYVTSSNAITENGELYNVDGNGNRVSAMIFGPKSVIVVAGYNKIVPDVEAAVNRVRKVAAPANAMRIDMNTPCTKTGECMNCKNEKRVCCSYTLLAQQRIRGRIKVILVGEQLGY